MESRTLTRIVPTSAAALGTVRAALFGFVLVDVLRTGFVDLSRLPITLVRPTGLLQIFSWRFYELILTPRGMVALKIALIGSLAAATAGYFTGAATKSAAVLFLFFQGLVRSFGHFNHDEMPVVYMLIVLAFTPCGDAFSVDSFLHRTRARLGDVVYGFPILLLRGLLAWSYFSSALIKLRVAGLGYFNSDNLPTVAILHSLDNLHETQHRLAFWLPSALEFTGAIALLIVLWELAFPLAIFSHLARRIILPFGIIFHVATIFFMNISFPYHLAAYVVFVDWPSLIARVKAMRFQGKRSSPRAEADTSHFAPGSKTIYERALTALEASFTKTMAVVAAPKNTRPMSCPCRTSDRRLGHFFV